MVSPASYFLVVPKDTEILEDNLACFLQCFLLVESLKDGQMYIGSPTGTEI